MFPCCVQCKGGDESQVGKRHLPFLETSFQKLSTEEKESVWRDLYGLDDGIINESDEFVDEKLDELNSEIERLSHKIKSAYMQAVDIESNQEGGEEYVTSRKFRLMFLRAERFNARLAARRISMHFTEKLKLFGKEKLACKIKEEDLNERDKEALSSGICVITGFTDESGRKVCIVHRHERIFNTAMSVNNLKRVAFYVTCSQIEDDEITQKKGLAIIANNIGPWDVKQTARLRKMLPISRMIYNSICGRVAAFHHCYNSPSYEFFMNMLLVVQPKYVRDRTQCHYGTHGECMAELTHYGIDPDKTPYGADGEMRMDLIKQHLEVLRKQRQVT